MSMYDYVNNILGFNRFFVDDSQRMENQNPTSPVNPMTGVFNPQSNVDTRQRRPLQQTSLTQTRIGDVTQSAQTKTDAFTSRAKGIGAKARIMDQNRRNALGLASQENRRRTQ